MPSSPAIRQEVPASLKYDPTVAFILEFCTRLAIRDEEAVETMGKQVFDVMQGILRDSSQWHAITVSRVVFYALSILKASYVSLSSFCLSLKLTFQDHDFANVPYLLHTLSSLPHQLLLRSAPLVLNGLSICIEQPGPLRSEMMTSPDFWAILRILAKSKEAAPMVFGILERGTSGSPPAVMSDNYEAAIGLLSEFATAAKPVVVEERRSGEGKRVVRVLEKDEDAVARGCKAVEILQSISARIPQLMLQSHLESSQGTFSLFFSIDVY